MDEDKPILLHQSPVLPSGSTLAGRHNVMKLTAQTKGPPCPVYFLDSTQTYEHFAVQQLPSQRYLLVYFLVLRGLLVLPEFIPFLLEPM